MTVNCIKCNKESTEAEATTTWTRIGQTNDQRIRTDYYMCQDCVSKEQQYRENAGKQVKLNNRVVVVESVYYQRQGSPPLAIDSRFSYRPTDDEQPYLRQDLEVEENWSPLDVGWLSSSEGGVSFFVISNREGKLGQRIPTPMERHLEEAKILEVGILAVPEEGKRDMYSPELTVIPFTYIPPRESVRLRAIDPSRYRIRCRKGTAKYTLTALPS